MLTAEAAKRQQKLAHARAKLRKYQQSRQSTDSLSQQSGVGGPISEGYPSTSVHSLADSTTSDGKIFIQQRRLDAEVERIDHRPPSVAASLPAGSSGFHHDEHRSPFQRVRGMSEASQGSSCAVSPYQRAIGDDNGGEEDEEQSTPTHSDANSSTPRQMAQPMLASEAALFSSSPLKQPSDGGLASYFVSSSQNQDSSTGVNHVSQTANSINGINTSSSSTLFTTTELPGQIPMNSQGPPEGFQQQQHPSMISASFQQQQQTMSDGKNDEPDQQQQFDSSSQAYAYRQQYSNGDQSLPSVAPADPNGNHLVLPTNPTTTTAPPTFVQQQQQQSSSAIYGAVDYNNDSSRQQQPNGSIISATESLLINNNDKSGDGRPIVNNNDRNDGGSAFQQQQNDGTNNISRSSSSSSKSEQNIINQPQQQEQQQQQPPATAHHHILDPLSSSSSSGSAAVTQQQGSSAVSTNSTNSNNENNVNNNGSEIGLMTSSVVMTASTTSVASTLVDPALEEIKTERDQLQSNYSELYKRFTEVSNQLQTLHAHYGQLHSAYTTLSQQHQQQGTNSTANGTNAATALDPTKLEEMRMQIEQHVKTVSVLVEEKADLQSQLRQAMEIANQKHVENEEMTGRLKANREKILKLEKEMDGSNSGRNNLEQTLNRQQTELTRLREETASLEARGIELGQDRSETQARLKMKAKEVDRLEAEMTQMRKDLHMKDIYVRQLTAAGAQPHLHQELEARREEMNQMMEAKNKEIVEAQEVAEKWRKEAAEGRAQYETYGRQLNQKVVDLSTQLEQMREEKFELECRDKTLHQEMEVLKIRLQETEAQNRFSAGANNNNSENNNNNSSSSAMVAGQNAENSPINDAEIQKAADHITVMELESQLKQAMQALEESEKNQKFAQESLASREEEICQLKRTLGLKAAEVVRLEEDLSGQERDTRDTRTLLEELDSEKATVSRAVAQNRELKDQLVELQEKFVKMSEDNMEATNKLQAAEHELIRIKEEFEQKADVLNQKETEVGNLQSRMNLIMSESLQNNVLKEEIKTKEGEEAELEQQLTHALHKIEQLDSEKTELMERIAFLNADAHDNVNDVLLEQKEREVKELQYRVSALTKDSYEASQMRTEILELRNQLQDTERTAVENAELHRIMEQNAADENQNTIYVELQQAFNRITTLSNENEGLRRQMATSREADEEDRKRSIDNINNQDGDDRSSLCSQHNEEKHDLENVENMEALRKNMEVLQERFVRAMDQNADLSDQNQQMEHLITHLQTETDTIGEYITIYQHQRKVMRERLKEREEYVAKMSHEKEEMQRKVLSLEDLVMRLLGEKGDLRAYYSLPPTTAKPIPGPPSIRRPHSPLSSDDQEDNDSVASASALNNNNNPNHQPAISMETATEMTGAGNSRSQSPVNSVASRHSLDPATHGGTAEQILRLLTEMKKPEAVDSRVPIDRNIHCKHCTGKVIDV